MGRPPMQAERRAVIFDAFIELIAERGLESVSLDDVAAAAGVQRSVIRHFVGNRADLVRGATTRLAERYGALVGERLGRRPDLAGVVHDLFGDGWVSGMAVEDAAFGQLVREAVFDDATRAGIKAMYDQLIAGVASLIRTEQPTLTAKAARDRAYVIVSAAEHNVVLRRLGFPASASKAAARLVLDRLGS